MTGRNDPCPCGSGKKFKKCCLGKEESHPSGGGATTASAELRKALEGRQFNSLEEVQAFAEQMYQMLNLPFTSPELSRFPDVLDTAPTAPLLSLFNLLVEAIGEQGLKPTAKGNLPRQFCRESALTYWGEETYQERTRYGGINKEDNFSDLHITRLVAEQAGLIRKYKERFILSRGCRKSLAGHGLAAIYPILFRTYVEQLNWSYRDRYPELRFIRNECFQTHQTCPILHVVR